jgi:hypothetical protein
MRHTIPLLFSAFILIQGTLRAEVPLNSEASEATAAEELAKVQGTWVRTINEFRCGCC